jgi:ferredoxin--NADP+ reductase
LSRFAGGQDLWLLSTGTGIAPFLSMLADPEVWERFETITLVHSVRVQEELAYRDWITALPSHEIFGDYAHKLRYIPVVTREDCPSGLHARLTSLIPDGRLEAVAGRKLDLDKSRIMLCGNPEMVNETRRALKSMGFQTSRQSIPGQIAVENYW